MEKNAVSLKNTLIEALKAPGGLLCEYFNKPIVSNRKESQSSIVTEADFKSESLIINTIEQKFSFHNFISEESGFRNQNSEFTWVIDPLDGTSNFVSGIPWFGVLITLFRNNNPIMGGAYLPVQNILYIAEKGKGASRNGKVLPSIECREISDSLIAFSVDYTPDKVLLEKELEIYKYIIGNARNIRSTNSLVDFIYVAESRFGGVLNFNTKVWDISALGLIISETGGTMKNMSGSDIHFSIGPELVDETFSVVAGCPQIVASLQKGLV